MEERNVQAQQDRNLQRELAVLLASGSDDFGLLMAIVALLRRFAKLLSPDTLMRLAQMGTAPLVPQLSVPNGPAQDEEREMAPHWRAVFLLAAADRLEEAAKVGDEDQQLAREVSYFDRHKSAEERRYRSAALVDMTAELMGDRIAEASATTPLLGWRAVLDDHTTPECRAAHGKNFRADRMPTIGWPGAVHPRCRCSAGPALPGAPLLPTL